MTEVLQAAVVFAGYAVLAIFAQNAIFSRALGVSRLVQLVRDDRTSNLQFSVLLCVTQLLAAPMAWGMGQLIQSLPYRAALRPLGYTLCIIAACLLQWLVLAAVRAKAGEERVNRLLEVLPLAALNSCVLGTLLLSRTQSFTLAQSIGFGLGSGLGYTLAVKLVSEAMPHLNSRAVPAAFRGLPITLIYIGVLALAIYGFTGHTIIL